MPFSLSWRVDHYLTTHPSPSPTKQCWVLVGAGKQTWRIQHCTGGVGALFAYHQSKCPNVIGESCLWEAETIGRQHTFKAAISEPRIGFQWNFEQIFTKLYFLPWENYNVIGSSCTSSQALFMRKDGILHCDIHNKITRISIAISHFFQECLFSPQCY